MKLLEGKHKLKHNLHTHYDTIKSFSKKKQFLKSDFYNIHHEEITQVIDGLEWDNSIATCNPLKEGLRIVSWNIERGLQLDGLIDYFKTNVELSQADVILAIETDNGMLTRYYAKRSKGN